ASLPHHASIHISLLSSTHPPTPQHSPLPLHDALPIFVWLVPLIAAVFAGYLLYNRLHEYGPPITIMFRDATGLKPGQSEIRYRRSEEHTSELQLPYDLVCRLLLEKKKDEIVTLDFAAR